jgi:hypothetical protein
LDPCQQGLPFADLTGDVGDKLDGPDQVSGLVQQRFGGHLQGAAVCSHRQAFPVPGLQEPGKRTARDGLLGAVQQETAFPAQDLSGRKPQQDLQGLVIV